MRKHLSVALFLAFFASARALQPDARGEEVERKAASESAKARREMEKTIAEIEQ